MQRYSGAIETSAEEERMIRYWIKLMLLTLLVLIQAACPRYFTQQPNEDARAHTPNDPGGSESGGG